MTATKIGEATLELNEWHSNVRDLEGESMTSDGESQGYVRRQLGTKTGESKLLRVPWEKDKDKTQVNFPTSTTDLTKRSIQGKTRDDLRSTRTSFTLNPLWKNSLQRCL